MKVLVADKFEHSGLDQIRGLGCEVLFQPEISADDLPKTLAETGAKVLVVRSTRVTRESLEAGSELAVVIRAGSGYDTIDTESARAANIRVCNTPGMNAVAVAELVIGLMVTLDRRIVDETDDIRRGVWNKKKYSKARGLKGRTLGIVGLGRIGWEVARRAAAFDMKLVYFDVFENQKAEQAFAVKRCSMDQLLAESDFVTLHVTGGADTHYLIGAEQLALMKPTAFLINCARGGIVDQSALADALTNDRLAGAALDAYETEPAATDTEFKDPIRSAPRLVGTHHVGASTQQAQTAVAEETVRVIDAFMKNGTFLHCVNEPASP